MIKKIVAVIMLIGGIPSVSADVLSKTEKNAIKNAWIEGGNAHADDHCKGNYGAKLPVANAACHAFVKRIHSELNADSYRGGNCDQALSFNENDAYDCFYKGGQQHCLNTVRRDSLGFREHDHMCVQIANYIRELY